MVFVAGVLGEAEMEAVEMREGLPIDATHILIIIFVSISLGVILAKILGRD